MESSYLSRGYNSPSSRLSPISLPQSNRHPRRTNYDLEIFIPDPPSGKYSAANNFTVEIFIPHKTLRLPRERHLTQFTMSDHGNNGGGQGGNAGRAHRNPNRDGWGPHPLNAQGGGAHQWYGAHPNNGGVPEHETRGALRARGEYVDAEEGPRDRLGASGGDGGGGRARRGTQRPRDSDSDSDGQDPRDADGRNRGQAQTRDTGRGNGGHAQRRPGAGGGRNSPNAGRAREGRTHHRDGNPPGRRLGRPGEDNTNEMHFDWSPRRLYDRAQLYSIPDEDAREFFPKIERFGDNRYLFMTGDTVIVDRFIDQGLLDHTPPQHLVAAYNHIFKHLLYPSPHLFERISSPYATTADPGTATCKDFLALSSLLSQTRGLGCDGRLLGEFATALNQCWRRFNGYMTREQQAWMFVANLEVFTDLLEGRADTRSAIPAEMIREIWEGCTRGVKARVREIVRAGAMRGEYYMRVLWEALELL